ncbi:hypothetical protein HAX54_035332 [Datura stramonium]|uniref:Uncharacterized protein n=1 Tax=Datura stramonium TaxID=4076 RepID=A0ABS8VFA1_DATST|nr:hypothetical protein [Datura stramonium]
MLGFIPAFNPLRVKSAHGRGRKERKTDSENDSDDPDGDGVGLAAMRSYWVGFLDYPREVPIGAFNDNGRVLTLCLYKSQFSYTHFIDPPLSI